jgi:hypothetical protein
MEWSEPTLFAQPKDNESEVDRASIAVYEDEILVIYNDYQPPKRMLRRSLDNGQTWLEPVEFLPPTRGEYGAANFFVDSNNDLHVVFGDRARGLSIWHSVLDGDRWQDPEPIVPLREAEAYEVGDPLEFHPQRPHSAISQGNVVLVTWRLDKGHGDNGTWFSYKVLDSPEIPPVPIKTQPVVPTSTPNVVDTTPTATPIRTLIASPVEGSVQSASRNPNIDLVQGVSPVILLLSIFIAFRVFRHRR